MMGTQNAGKGDFTPAPTDTSLVRKQPQAVLTSPQHLARRDVVTMTIEWKGKMDPNPKIGRSDTDSNE